MAKFSDVHDAADHTGLTGVVDGIPKTLLDAKGDLVAASAADTPAKVTVGSNGSGLIADSGASAGVSWLKHNLAGGAAPGTGDDSGDGYAVGSRWIDTTNDKEYVCLDATLTAAVWTETTGGGGGDVATDSIWDAAGDLAVGSGSNAAARLAAGSEGEVLTIASGVPSWEPAGGGGGEFAPTVVGWVVEPAASTNSLAVTIPAAADGNRLIVAVASYARDVNTPTCTNVTFTEVLSANFGGAYLSVYVGVVSGGASATTLTVTAGSSDYIYCTVIEVENALTPTVVDSATKTGTDAQTDSRAVIGPLDVSVGDLFVLAWSTNNASNAVSIEATSPMFTLPQAQFPGMVVGVGLAGATKVAGYFMSVNASGVDYASGIVAVS